MFEINPLIQVIISLIILLLMGYIGYNIYLIELQNMFKGENDIRKEVSLLSGVYDFINSEAKYNTYDKTQLNFKDVKPSINQEGGAEYSYNFWLFTDHDKLKKEGGNKDKDTILFLKGEKYLYYNDKSNYNCSTSNAKNNTIVVLTKNPLVRLSADGKSLAVEYNNVYNADSYKQGSVYKRCAKLKDTGDWKSKNNNMLGIYDIDFNNKWFMVTIIMKEVADSNNIISVNRASCKIYINGSKLFDKKVETKYNKDLVSATLKNNNSPFYINPDVSKSVSGSAGIESPYNKIAEENTLKIADIKYYNYAISEDMISSLYNKGFNTEIAVTSTIDNKLSKYNMVSVDDMEDNEIKAL